MKRYLVEHGFEVLIGYKDMDVPFLSKLFHDNTENCLHFCLATQAKAVKDNDCFSCCWWRRLFRHRGGQR